MRLWAPLRLAAVGGLSGGMLAALTIEETVGVLDDARRAAYGQTWARSLLQVLDVRASIDAGPGVLANNGRPRLVVANHRSTLDILLILRLFGGNLLARG